MDALITIVAAAIIINSQWKASLVARYKWAEFWNDRRESLRRRVDDSRWRV